TCPALRLCRRYSNAASRNCVHVAALLAAVDRADPHPATRECQYSRTALTRAYRPALGAVPAARPGLRCFAAALHRIRLLRFGADRIRGRNRRARKRGRQGSAAEATCDSLRPTGSADNAPRLLCPCCLF